MAAERVHSFLLPNHNEAEWERIVSCLKTSSLSSWEELKDVIRHLSVNTDEKISTDGTQDFSGLSRMIDSLEKADSNRLCAYALPAIVAAALSLSDEFKEGELFRVPGGSGDRTEKSYTELQIRSVLAHMLLCTTRRQGCVRYWSHFGVWLHSGRSPPVVAYLRCLFEYFADPTTETPTRRVSFILRSISRCTAFPSRDSPTPLGAFAVHDTGAIGDVPDEIEVDFANCTVSFGRGGTQEEILLGMSPELCVIPLIVDTMSDDDALVVQGARRCGRHHGYGLDLVYVEPVGSERVPTGGWSQRYLVAMDATNFSYEEWEYLRLFRSVKGDEQEIQRRQLLEQLHPEAIHRELRKAFCAFQPLASPKHSTFNSRHVATGLWGCGAYGGDPELKAMIQWVAASETGRNLSFYTFGDRELASTLQRCVTELHSRHLGVGELLQWIDSFAKHVEDVHVRDLSFISFMLEKLSVDYAK